MTDIGRRRFAPEQGPDPQSSDRLAQQEWLTRQFREVAHAIDQTDLLDVSQDPVPAVEAQEGMMRYVKDDSLGYGPGPYVYRCVSGVCFWSPMFADGESWDDLKAPATAINPPGLASDPTFDTTEGYWSFADAKTELLFITLQFDHGYKEGSDIFPHVHWIQTAAGLPLWRASYKWYNNGDPYPAAFTDLDVSNNSFAYTSGNLAQISYFPSISGTGKKISSIFQLKLQRIGADAADTLNGASAHLTEFDIHILKNYRGSTEEFTKYTP